MQTGGQANGPVQKNLPVSEPLYEKTKEKLAYLDKSNLPKLANKAWGPEVTETHRKQWNTAKKKLVLVGVLAPNSLEQRWIDNLMEDPSVLRSEEHTSELQ